MRVVRTEQVPKTEMAGLLLGLFGSLLVLIPQVDRVFAFTHTWTDAVALAMIAGVGLVGVYLGLREHPIVGAIVAGSAGLALAIVGTLVGGSLLLLGGALVFLAPRPHPRTALSPEA